METEGCTYTDGLLLGDDEGAPDTDGACDGSVEMLGPSDGWLEVVDVPLELVLEGERRCVVGHDDVLAQYPVRFLVERVWYRSSG